MMIFGGEAFEEWENSVCKGLAWAYKCLARLPLHCSQSLFREAPSGSVQCTPWIQCNAFVVNYNRVCSAASHCRAREGKASAHLLFPTSNTRPRRPSHTLRLPLNENRKTSSTYKRSRIEHLQQRQRQEDNNNKHKNNKDNDNKENNKKTKTTTRMTTKTMT